MAIYNEILVGRYNRFLQKLFGMKGPVPAPQLAGDITVALALFNGNENRYLEGWERFGVTISQAAVAANSSGARLRNPANSNVIAVLEKIMAFSTTASDQFKLEQAATGTDLGTVGALTNARFDARTRPQPTCIISTASPAASLVALKAQIAVAASTSGEFITDSIHELTLLPGDAYQVLSNQVNQNLFATFWWRERFLEEGERT